MPITEKATIHSKCIFSKDRKHKFLLTMEWEDKKPKAVVIMTSPAEANCIITDLTTSLVIKNLYQLGYGGCDLVNLGSKLGYHQRIVDKTEESYNQENRQTILKCAADTKNDTIILAWGSCGHGNKRIQGCQNTILEMLSAYREKLFVIQDGRGKKGLHPLTPSIRHHWKLIPWEPEESVQNDTSETAQESTPTEETTPDASPEQDPQ